MSRFARQLIKLPLLCRDLVSPRKTLGYTFLIYHSVSGRLPLELDIDFSLFRRQLDYLHAHSRIVRFEQAVEDLLQGCTPSEPTCVLTFDDGYEDFYHRVFPLLRQLNLPAILYVTTGFVEDGVPYPILRHRSSGVHPVTWEMLGEMAESNLVTIGAHTHTHPDLAALSASQVEEELARPLEIFKSRLGLDVEHFCYPKALWNEHVEQWVTRYYRSAVISRGRSATAAGFNPYRIPRLPVRRSDGWFFFQAKMRGWLQTEERAYEQIHHLHRAARHLWR